MRQPTPSLESDQQCDDTAYPIAAMPDECTCPNEDAIAQAELDRRARIRIYGADLEVGR